MRIVENCNSGQANWQTIGKSGEQRRGEGKEEIEEGCDGVSLAAGGGQFVVDGWEGNRSSCWRL